MAREIRFRVWNGFKMEYNIMAGFLGAFYVQGMDEKDSACMSPFNTKYHAETPIMQFTGLLDKSDKEIYDGDILKHDNGYLCKIYWGHHLWAVSPIEEKPTEEYQDACFPNQFIVVGNIYENSNLGGVNPINNTKT